MNKDNILFCIIGVLLGFIVGFLFANSANNRAPAPRAATTTAATTSASASQGSELPSNAVADQSAVPQEMKDALQRAKSEPNNFDAQMTAARQLYDTKMYDQAIEFLVQANQLRPDDYETITALGNTYFDAGRFELAEKWYTAALAKKPDDVNVRTDLGLTFFFRTPRDIERAIKEFRSSLERDPNHESTLVNLIIVLTEKGDTKESQAALARLEKINPNNSALPKLRERVEAKAK
jgi:tetratricopeptide (TPR) repeat protein